MRTYEELISLPTFKERFEYCKLDGAVSEETLGGYRELCQIFYKSPPWKDFRKEILIRDNFCDLAHPDFEIRGAIYIHHLNPITYADLLYQRPCLLDPNNVACVSFKTHQYITYGLPVNKLYEEPIVRTANDTCPWKAGQNAKK